jgi:hypothetical protein
MKMVRSKESQEVVIKDGYIALPAQVAQKQIDGVLAGE